MSTVSDGGDVLVPTAELPSRPPARRTAAQLLVVALLALASWVLVHHVPYEPWHNFFDLRIYHGAVSWWRDGRPLYSYLWRDGPYGFTYPPFAALLMLPMSLVPMHLVAVLHTAGCAVVVLAGTWWLVVPLADRRGWPRWFTWAAAVPVVFALEPVRETMGFGQVNLFLAALVVLDLRALRRGRRWAGIGTGLAAAVKLTPAVFVLYLVVTRRWRAAGVATGTFLGAALVSWAVAGPTSWQFWSTTLWDTDRVGRLDKTSNQSLLGLLARLATPGTPDRHLWAVLVLAVLGVALWRAQRAFRAGDDLVGFVLSGLAAALISPISWTHHLVWVVPAIAVLLDVALTPVAGVGRVQRRRRTAAAVGAGAVLAAFLSSLVWFFQPDPGWAHSHAPFDVVGENAYVLIMVGLVLLLPVRGGTDPTPRPAPARAGRRLRV